MYDFSIHIFLKTKFHCLVAVTSGDIEQYVYYNYFLSSLRRHNFEINENKSGQKFKYLKNKKSFNHEIKNLFHHF